MKKTLMIGAALSLLLSGGVAFADPAPSPAGAPPATTSNVTPEAGPLVKADYDQSGPQGKWRHDGRHGWDQHGQGDPDRHGGHRFGGWQSGGPEANGARIVLERHGNRIAVKCAANDSTQQCVDAVKDLIGTIAETMPHGRRDEAPQSSPGDLPEMPDGPAQ